VIQFKIDGPHVAAIGVVGAGEPVGWHAAPFRWDKEQAMKKFVKSFVRDDRGMETVEWAVLAALIVAGLVAVIGGLGTNVLNKFTALQNATQ
jgi:pilus assembly protein Flp/PilA